MDLTQSTRVWGLKGYKEKNPGQCENSKRSDSSLTLHLPTNPATQTTKLTATRDGTIISFLEQAKVAQNERGFGSVSHADSATPSFPKHWAPKTKQQQNKSRTEYANSLTCSP